MGKCVYIICFVFCLNSLLLAQGILGYFSKTALTAQFAGSTGLYSFGISKVTQRDKLEIGLLYGRVPAAFGGINHAFVLKTTYNPFHLELSKKIKLEPVQTGFFLSQNFNRHLKTRWGDDYPKGYYWWNRSLRLHAFLGTQVSYKLDTKYFDRIGLYFEANTNDLYFASYIENRKALSLYDIFFFGTGIKLYLH